MLQKMQEIREMQEKLTLKHFEIDQMRMNHERCVNPWPRFSRFLAAK